MNADGFHGWRHGWRQVPPSLRVLSDYTEAGLATTWDRDGNGGWTASSGWKTAVCDSLEESSVLA